MYAIYEMILGVSNCLSIIIMFLFGTPLLLNRLVQAIADAPAPLTTTLISLIDFFDISKALIKAARVIIAVPC